MNEKSTPESGASRREFLTTAAAGVAAASSLMALNSVVHAQGSDAIRVGVIGCGGRGQGASKNVLMSAKGVEIIAIGDYARKDDQRGVEPARKFLIDFAKNDETVKSLGNKVDLPEERCYVGLDAYQKVINTPGVNYVILATPPGFRPIHLKAAVDAGKNIFTEKPVAVDGPGIRTCFKLYEEAGKRGLAIVAGTQRRHQLGYLETMKQIHDGAIGDIVGARCFWNQGNIWFRPRRPGMSDLDYQVHNWYHFGYLCGDHIAEQHVHNLDVVNWAIGKPPVQALGMGGRVRPYSDPQVDGNIFNFFAIDFEYPEGVHVLSMCRQVEGSDANFKGVSGQSEALVGTKGTSQVNAYQINGKPVISREKAREATDPYVQEHTDLIASIRAGKPLNELKNVTESTLTALMGRMAAYTGRAITWDQALNSQQVLMPENLSADSLPPVLPLAVPGKTKFI